MRKCFRKKNSRLKKVALEILIVAAIDKIDILTINYEFIEFKAIYTGTNTEVKEGNVIATKRIKSH